jgi:hypothetical protein
MLDLVSRSGEVVDGFSGPRRRAEAGLLTDILLP